MTAGNGNAAGNNSVGPSDSRQRPASYLADEEERERDRLRAIAEAEELAERAERREERQRQSENERDRRNADPVAAAWRIRLF